MKSKKAELMKTEEWWVPGTGVWGHEEMLAKGSKLPATRDISSGNLLYSMVTTVNNTYCILEIC